MPSRSFRSHIQARADEAASFQIGSYKPKAEAREPDFAQRNPVLHAFGSHGTHKLAHMHHATVQSSALRSVGYDPDARVLEIEFVSGTCYRYFDVPEAFYAGLMTAASHGEFFTAHIRDGGFDYEEIT